MHTLPAPWPPRPGLQPPETVSLLWFHKKLQIQVPACLPACPFAPPAAHPLAQHPESAAALEELRTLFGFLGSMGALGPIVFDLRCEGPGRESECIA